MYHRLRYLPTVVLIRKTLSVVLSYLFKPIWSWTDVCFSYVLYLAATPAPKINILRSTGNSAVLSAYVTWFSHSFHEILALFSWNVHTIRHLMLTNLHLYKFNNESKKNN